MSNIPEYDENNQQEFIGEAISSFSSHHRMSSDGIPLGGQSYGCGFAIAWQDGALREGVKSNELAIANGAFVEDLIEASIDRLEFYQNSEFKSEYNEEAIVYLKRALNALDNRTKEREAHGVEGTHEI